MSTISCGIDFGTSNSSIALAKNGQISLVAVEDAHVTIPSAIFFSYADRTPYYGRVAVRQFLNRQDGRFMRSLKRVLGTSVMKNGTIVQSKLLKFEDIIGGFLLNLKDKAELQTGQELTRVVMGRPVHFVDNDPEADARAEAELQAIAQRIGFTEVAFQFEPIAAAFAHEVQVSGEKLAIVVDLGGGTSDFTIIRLSDQYVRKTDRSSDILANTGVRVGGNDFDKDLSLDAIMPELGYKTTYGDKKLQVPLRPYYDLSEWSKVNFLYTTKLVIQTRQMLNQSHDKVRFGRLLRVLEQETGHALLAAIEEAKIALTSQTEFLAPFDCIEKELSIAIHRQQFEEAIQEEIDKITQSAIECLQLAQVHKDAIELVILTGGSTEIPMIQSAFRNLFPNAAIADENKLSSVGLGLAYDSQNRFR